MNDKIPEEKTFKENKGMYDLSGNSELLLSQLIDVESKYYNTIAEMNIAEETKKYLTPALFLMHQSIQMNLLIFI